MSGMMKKITRESKLSLQVDTYDYLGTKSYIETGWATAFNSAPHELLNRSKLDAFVTNQTTKVDTSQVALIRTKVTPCPTLSPGPDDEEDKEHLKARDPTDQLVEGPYCQTEVVQVRIKLRARQSSLDGMGEQIYTTGPEIWQQTKKVGGLNGFVCLTGTGGTLDGVTRYLKGVSNGKVRCFLADPPGSVLYSFIKSGRKLIDRTGSSITKEIDSGLIDDAIYISDEESIEMVYRMLDKEGIYLSGSSALNVVVAVKMAEQMGKGKRIVTMLCDSASKYQSRFFLKSWLESKNLYSSIPERLKKYAILA
ncbi:tryptophan synthase beta subunit-like PLP-dependent enzyme [Phakopsora pachyrhizi]|uniref:Tryptophan synthase beta subunit-like PLP-dependent enzyme n=1 Tax=Phakopsora pachyrhizi TaxID=170000 RepID=A0AAV0ALD3_PHAPC|nr:tryptophan synthase beta subunit-like PLP-dependent enzyme [Phakopsora pachyrhizi]